MQMLFLLVLTESLKVAILQENTELELLSDLSQELRAVQLKLQGHFLPSQRPHSGIPGDCADIRALQGL